MAESRLMLIRFIMLLLLIHLSYSDCRSICTKVQSPNSLHPCEVCYTNCDSQYSIYSCYEFYEDCSVVLRGECAPVKNQFPTEPLCKQQCCGSLEVSECVEKYKITPKIAQADMTWLWIVLGVVPSIILLILGGCYLWQKKIKQLENQDDAHQQQAAGESQKHIIADSINQQNRVKSADVLSSASSL